MRIPSGVVDQVMYFVAVDATDQKTRETGLTAFTVYRDRNGGGAAAMTTPTVTEVDAVNMPGVYKLLCDEDMTIGAGNDSEEMAYHITQAAMAPVTRVIEIYRRTVTAGNTLGVAADGDVSGNVDGSVASVTGSVASVTGAVGSVTAAVVLPTIPANWISAAGIAASAMNGKGDWNIGKTGYALTQAFPANFADMAIAVTTGKVTIGTNDDKAGYSISGAIATLDGLENVAAAEIVSAGAITTLAGAVVNVDSTDSVTGSVGSVAADVGVNEWNGVALSTTNPLPNAAAGAAGGLPTDSAGKTAFNDITAANVNAEVVDVMVTDIHGEPAQGTPGETVSMEYKIAMLYKTLINEKDFDGTTIRIMNYAATVVDQKRPASQVGNTYTEENIVTGP